MPNTHAPAHPRTVRHRLPGATLEPLERRLLLTATYYVADPRGLDGIADTADDVIASDTYPGSESQPLATLAAATALAAAGDTVLIRGGTYNEALVPRHSGTQGAYITYRNYAEETVTITGASLSPGVNISGRSYIAIRGLTVRDVNRWLYAVDSHYNIIEGNHFANAINPGRSSKGGLFFQEAHHNQILDNVIGGNTEDNIALHAADYNLVAGNTITRAGHTLWTIKSGSFNVLRNNYFHNDLEKIGEVFDAWEAGFDHELFLPDGTKRNLITDNTFDFTPSSGNTAPYAGIQYAGQDGIVRRNSFYDTTGPGLSLTVYGDEAEYNTGNRVYNNVFSGTDLAGVSIADPGLTFDDNVLTNNVFSGSAFVANDTRWSWYTDELAGRPVQVMAGRLDGFVLTNNDFTGPAGIDEPYLFTHGIRWQTANPTQQTIAWWEANYPDLFADNVTADPGFLDEAGRDFSLSDDSAMIDTGAFLTAAVADGEGTILSVADASYFYDGYGIVGEVGDTIQLAGRPETAVVVDIDYAANTLTLDRALSWSTGQGVALRYTGTGPDIGVQHWDGDFNRDNCVDAADIDLLAAAIRAGGDDPAFDLIGEGHPVLDRADLNAMLTKCVFVGGDPYTRGTRSGDLNLDGWVDDNDLSLMTANWQTGTTWRTGNVIDNLGAADPIVEDNDLSILLANWTGMPAEATVPPEAVATEAAMPLGASQPPEAIALPDEDEPILLTGAVDWTIAGTAAPDADPGASGPSLQETREPTVVNRAESRRVSHWCHPAAGKTTVVLALDALGDPLSGLR